MERSSSHITGSSYSLITPNTSSNSSKTTTPIEILGSIFNAFDIRNDSNLKNACSALSSSIEEWNDQIASLQSSNPTESFENKAHFGSKIFAESIFPTSQLSFCNSDKILDFIAILPQIIAKIDSLNIDPAIKNNSIYILNSITDPLLAFLGQTLHSEIEQQNRILTEIDTHLSIFSQLLKTYEQKSHFEENPRGGLLERIEYPNPSPAALNSLRIAIQSLSTNFNQLETLQCSLKINTFDKNHRDCDWFFYIHTQFISKTVDPINWELLAACPRTCKHIFNALSQKHPELPINTIDSVVSKIQTIAISKTNSRISFGKQCIKYNSWHHFFSTLIVQNHLNTSKNTEVIFIKTPEDFLKITFTLSALLNYDTSHHIESSYRFEYRDHLTHFKTHLTNLLQKFFPNHHSTFVHNLIESSLFPNADSLLAPDLKAVEIKEIQDSIPFATNHIKSSLSFIKSYLTHPDFEVKEKSSINSIIRHITTIQSTISKLPQHSPLITQLVHQNIVTPLSNDQNFPTFCQNLLTRINHEYTKAGLKDDSFYDTHNSKLVPENLTFIHQLLTIESYLRSLFPEIFNAINLQYLSRTLVPEFTTHYCSTFNTAFSSIKDILDVKGFEGNCATHIDTMVDAVNNIQYMQRHNPSLIDVINYRVKQDITLTLLNDPNLTTYCKNLLIRINHECNKKGLSLASPFYNSHNGNFIPAGWTFIQNLVQIESYLRPLFPEIFNKPELSLASLPRTFGS